MVDICCREHKRVDVHRQARGQTQGLLQDWEGAGTRYVTVWAELVGAFGEVRMCIHRESGAQRAVKVLRKSHMDEDEKRMLFNEINILKEIVSHCLFYLTICTTGSPKHRQNVRVL